MKARAYYLTTVGAFHEQTASFYSSHWLTLDPSADPAAPATEIVVLVEAEEGMHVRLEEHPGFDALPSILSQRTLKSGHADKLSRHGVGRTHTMFDAAEILGGVHPAMRPRAL